MQQCNGYLGALWVRAGDRDTEELWVFGFGALKSAATVTSFVFLFTVLCFLYFVTVNQFCMSDFFTRLRQLYNLLIGSYTVMGKEPGGIQGLYCRVAGR